MKTALDIKMRQEQLREEARHLSASKGTPTEVRRDKRQAKQKLKLIKWMDKALAYAETNPQPEYVRQQIIMLQEKIKRADQRVFDEIGQLDPRNPEVKKLIKAAEKEEGLPKMEEQLKFLKFINS
jgi:hypothetical protein